MDNISYTNGEMANAGVPYENINWYDIMGQPFGAASGFNVIIFNDANNIIDIEGPVAIGRSFYSSRGLSVGFVKKGNRAVNYSPDLVRFLVGGDVSMTGPLVVIGHVVGGGGFRAANGSTYLIGKNGMNDGIQELKFLYQANGGSRYWTPSDKGDHYVVPSYDVPRYIPAARINADIPGFFSAARASIENYKNCIDELTPNGTVINNSYEWILRGNDPVQNVFLIDVRPNGSINKGIRAEVPQGSTVVVRLRTGANAHLQYGLYGEKSKANQTLYVFEDATNIYMEKSSDIWGSILAPQAMFHGHPTGGHVSGNAALGAFAVNAASGFEFHYYPFTGRVMCQAMPTPVVPTPVIPAPVIPTPVIPVPVIPTPVVPTPAVPAPEIVCPECPACPVPLPCPMPEPCPTCPTPEPCPACPVPPPCPTPEPCPACPIPPPCPIPEPCPACPVPPPCPSCPACPIPEPCPVCPVCPVCPSCPEPEKIFISVPIPMPVECPRPEICPKAEPCPVCQECMIKSGIIKGCIHGCCCKNFHDWDVKLYERCNDKDTVLCCVTVNGQGCFEFKVPFDGFYILTVRMSDNCSRRSRGRGSRCKPNVTLNNIGVKNFRME